MPRGFLIGHLFRDCRQWSIFGQDNILCMSTKSAAIKAKYFIANAKTPYAFVDCFNLAGRLVSKNRVLWFHETTEKSEHSIPN